MDPTTKKCQFYISYLNFTNSLYFITIYALLFNSLLQFLRCASMLGHIVEYDLFLLEVLAQKREEGYCLWGFWFDNCGIGLFDCCTFVVERNVKMKLIVVRPVVEKNIDEVSENVNVLQLLHISRLQITCKII